MIGHDDGQIYVCGLDKKKIECKDENPNAFIDPRTALLRKSGGRITCC